MNSLDNADEIDLALDQMLSSMKAGIDGINLRRLMIPHNLESASTVINHGSAAQVDHLMRDILGESLGLAAGSSLLGSQAMQALGLAQAQCFTRMRIDDVGQASLIRSSRLMSKHVQQLRSWVSNGCMPNELVSSPSDLTRIGQELLMAPHIRLSAIGIYIAGAHLLHSSLSAFSS